MQVGGLAMHWGGVTPRWSPEDFRTKSLFGIGTDWPLTYEELDPYYQEAEALIGVAGEQGPATMDPRGKPFPMAPMDAVPTTVAEGPDGYLYVGQLTGFPFPLGGANVYRIAPHNVPETAPEVFATGFTNIIDIAFDASGSLYVLEIARNSLLSAPFGRLVRVDPDGSQVEIATDQPLFAPGGLAIGKDGDIYVTVGSVAPGIGQVLRLDM
jgi:hypothetical protein